MIIRTINETRGLASQTGYDVDVLKEALHELDELIPYFGDRMEGEMDEEEEEEFDEQWNQYSILPVEKDQMSNIEEVLENNFFNDKKQVNKYKKKVSTRGITYTVDFKNYWDLPMVEILIDYDNSQIEITPLV